MDWLEGISLGSTMTSNIVIMVCIIWCTQKYLSTKNKPMAKPKTTISPEEQYQYDKDADREIWKEKGCPFFKTGTHEDKKKRDNKRKCREKVNPEDT